jgi:hypothetical protein
LRLLFPIKFFTTLLKGALPCKVSKIDFLNGQTRASYGQMVVKPLLEGIFAILININLAPRVTLSITKVLWGIIGYSTFLLPNYPVSTDMS